MVVFLFTTVILGVSLVEAKWNHLKDQCEASGKDPPHVIVNHPWMHVGAKSTVTLHCQVCLPPEQEGAKVWWKKDGEAVRHSSRLRSLTHRKTHHLLRIKSVREKDLGSYECGVNVGKDGEVVSGTIELSGVPYPAKFDLPTLWSDSTFKLSWRVNCSTPIINYQLEFRELPEGKWVGINVPGDSGFDSPMGGSHSSSSSRLQQRSRGGHFGGGSSSRGGAGGVEVHARSYTLKGLKRDTSYEARVRSRNSYGLSAQSDVISFHTFDIQERKAASPAASGGDSLLSPASEVRQRSHATSTTTKAAKKNARKDEDEDPFFKAQREQQMMEPIPFANNNVESSSVGDGDGDNGSDQYKRREKKNDDGGRGFSALSSGSPMVTAASMTTLITTLLALSWMMTLTC